jgi:hypothetical protein
LESASSVEPSALGQIGVYTTGFIDLMSCTYIVSICIDISMIAGMDDEWEPVDEARGFGW